MTPLTDEMRERLEALLAKATPGPWFYRPREGKHGGAWIADHPDQGRHSKIIVTAGSCYGGSDDYELIAEAVTVLPDLLAREAALTKERADLNEYWVDDFGTAWTRPTGWAYAMACKTRDRLEAQSAALTKELEAAMEGLRPFAETAALQPERGDDQQFAIWHLRMKHLRRAAQLVADHSPVAGEDDTVLRSGGAG